MLSLDRVLYSRYITRPTMDSFRKQKLKTATRPMCLFWEATRFSPGCVVRVRPIGMLNMIDAGEQDNKILGVQADNPRFDNIKDISDIEKFHTHHLKEIAHFFQTYKELQGKKLKSPVGKTPNRQKRNNQSERNV